MKIKPIKNSVNTEDESFVTDDNPMVYMFVSASDSWGNEHQGVDASYSAIGLLTDENGVIKKRLSVELVGEDYLKWDGNNKTILQMFLDKYDYLQILE